MATVSNTASTAEYPGPGIASAPNFVHQITRFGRRLRLLAVLLRSARALWVAALLYVGLSLVGSLLAPQFPVFAISLLLALGVFLALVVPTFLRRLSTLDIAKAYDARLALSERLATTIEMLGQTPENPFRAVLLEDAWRHVQEIRPRQVFPFRLPQRDVLLLVLGLVALFLWEVFPYMAGQLTPLAPLAHQVAAVREGTLIERTSPDALVAGEEALSPADGKELAEPEASQGAAQPEQNQPLLTQSDLNEQQAQAQQGQEGEEGQAGEGGEEQAGFSDLAQQLEAYRNPHINEQATALAEVGRELTQARPSREAGQNLERGNYEQAAQALEELARDVRDLSREDRNDMTDAFAKAAERAQQSDPRLAQELADVSREVASYNDRATERELQELGDAIEERGQRIRAQQQSEQQSEQLRAGAGGEEAGAQQGDAQQLMARAQQAFNTSGVTEQSGPSQQQDNWQLQAGSGGPSQGGGNREEESFQPGPQAPRLQIEQKPSVVLADRGIGPSLWSPQRAPVAIPGPGSAPAQFGVTDAGNAIISTGGASHFVPWMVADYVQKYFNALSNAMEQAP
ncbi:MAG: hypothetical protein OXM03_11675 [Chloroflexota bacterium]|nr:hypothetical protein [Chloroflexota bacterium]MDE2930373.1 hypothetical protein [Chloroflexota bacterium]